MAAQQATWGPRYTIPISGLQEIPWAQNLTYENKLSVYILTDESNKIELSQNGPGIKTPENPHRALMECANNEAKNLYRIPLMPGQRNSKSCSIGLYHIFQAIPVLQVPMELLPCHTSGNRRIPFSKFKTLQNLRMIIIGICVKRIPNLIFFFFIFLNFVSCALLARCVPHIYFFN